MTRLFRDLFVSTLAAPSEAFGSIAPIESVTPIRRSFTTRFTSTDDCIQRICSREYYEAVFRVTGADDIAYSPDPPSTYTATEPQQITYRRRPSLAGIPVPIPRLEFSESWSRIGGDRLRVDVDASMMRFNVEMSFGPSVAPHAPGVAGSVASSPNGHPIDIHLEGRWESGPGFLHLLFGNVMDQMVETMEQIMGAVDAEQ
jgi:hypothetical protein